MNKLLLSFLLAIFAHTSAYAQAPKGINYQGVARDNEGKPIASKIISVRISILKNATQGEVEYSETHKPQTNQFGLFSLIIGQGTAGTGAFAFVSWAVGNKWLQIEIDPEGGSSFLLAGSQQLMSVPYAFYSEYSGNDNNLSAGQGISIQEGIISNSGDADNSPTNELITGALLTADKKLRITDAGGTKEVDLNTIANTDNQSLSITGSTLAISGGNTVDLSTLTGSSQNLSLGTSDDTNRTINITNGTGVTLDVADNDNSSTNEIQALTKTGATINLSNGGAITLNDDSETNEIQALTKLGTTILLSNGGGSITLNDDNVTNEIQALTKVGTTVSLSNGGGAVTLNDDSETNEIQALTKLGTTISLSNGGGSITLNDDNVTNEIQALTKVGTTVSLSNGGGSITLIDDNVTNEIQALTKVGTTVSLSNGGGSFTLNDDNATNEIQALTKVGTTISLSNGGGSITLIDDNVTNEIQALTKVGTTVSLSNGGGSITLIDDNVTNEIQALTKVGTTISLSNGGGSIALNDDNVTNEIQALTKVGTTISLSNGGGSITLNDDNVTNEIQALTKVGTTISLSNGGGSITLIDDNVTNEIQALTKVGTTISLSNGGGAITLNDDNETNEIQDLALNSSTNILSLSNAATTVDLTPYKQNLSQVLNINPSAGDIRIQNVGAPTANTDATTKGYVDTSIATAVATNYAFKTSFSFLNSGSVFTDTPITLVDVFDDFNIVTTNRFTAPVAGVYSFSVSGTSPVGGALIKFRVTSGSASLYDIKQTVAYPNVTIINYQDSNIYKLNAGDIVELVVTSLLLGQRVDGILFGYKL